ASEAGLVFAASDSWLQKTSRAAMPNETIVLFAFIQSRPLRDALMANYKITTLQMQIIISCKNGCLRERKTNPFANPLAKLVLGVPIGSAKHQLGP
ncbi:MAG: hypothetical protein DM484_15250, partial [Candidatus Methylumidiphilus alinenensis]